MGPPSDAGGSASGQVVARAGIAWGLAAAVLQGLVHTLNVVVFGLSIGSLNADLDFGVFMWVSTGFTFTAGVMVAAIGVLAPLRRSLVWALAAALLVLSLDDMLGLHERLAATQPTIGGLEHATRLFWPVATMPLLAAVFLGLWVISRTAVGWARTAVRLGLGALVLAVGLEMATPLLFALGQDHGDLGYESEVVVEEGLELFGWIAIAGGLLGRLMDVTVLLEQVGRETRPHRAGERLHDDGP